MESWRQSIRPIGVDRSLGAERLSTLGDVRDRDGNEQTDRSVGQCSVGVTTSDR